MGKQRTTLLLAGLALAVSAQAQPYGAGMMGGGNGPGPGMMGGYGMGPGMMGGYGPGGDWGMGPGMMGGLGYGDWVLERADLSAEQRAKIVDIQKELSNKQWDAMRRMHDQQWQMRRNAPGGAIDEQAARAAYTAMSDAHRQMFELSLDARKRIDALLTPQQREQLARPRGRP